MRTLLSFRLALGFALGLPLVGCQNFNQCTSDSECQPLQDGTKQYCTPDNICARGTPAAGLCTTVYPPNSPANAIAIGALVNLVGGNDDQPLKAFKLGIDQVNKSRAPDPPLALHICEVSATSDDSLKSMEVLARQRKAVAVVGPTSSSKVLQIKDEVIRSGIPIMSPSATSPEISALGNNTGPVNGLFFRVAPSDAIQGAVLAHQLPKPFVGKLGLISVDDSYGNGLTAAFLAISEKQPDISVQYSEPAAMPDFPGTMAAAGALIAAKPDFVIAITNLYSDTVVKALLPLQTTPILSKIIMADGARNQNVLNLSNSVSASGPFIYTSSQMNNHLARISGTAPTVDTGGGALNAFINDYKVAFAGEDPAASIYTAYAYDSLFAVAIAIGAAGADVTPTRVAEMLGHMNKFDPATNQCIIDAGNANMLLVGQTQFLAAKNKVAIGAGLVLQGASGAICFNAHGDRVAGLYEKWTINAAATPPKFDSAPTM